MHWIESPRRDEIAAFAEGRDRVARIKHPDPRSAPGFPWPDHELVAGAGDALEDCLAELWRKLLTDGRELLDRFPWGVPVEDGGYDWSRFDAHVERGDPDGSLVGSVAIRGTKLTFPGIVDPPVAEDESTDDMERNILVLELGVYAAVRTAVRRPDVWPLFRELAAVRPLTARGSVRDGFVDLRLGEPAMGPLPAYDQGLLDAHPNPQELMSPLCRPLVPGAVPYNVVRGSGQPPGEPPAT